MLNVEQEVRGFIVDNFLFGQEATFSDDDSFLEQGIIDSTGMLELVNFLEEQYGIKVEDEDLVPENLDSITRLGRYVRGKRNGRGAAHQTDAGR